MSVATGSERTRTQPKPLRHPRTGSRSLEVPHQLVSVPRARRQMMGDLQTVRVDDEVLSEAAVVVSELLGNAVRHARPLPGGTICLKWQVRGEVIEVEVVDGGGPGSVVPSRPGPMSMSGRGLRIVRGLAHEWGVLEDEAETRTVWAALGGPSRRRRP